ncbi:MAG: amino acid ABC transporter permease [Gemmobacter sp.]|nr:amino acid ABC transporter permease [Gemmobacter sp.]
MPSILEELPRFFNYYNSIFLAKAFLYTLVLSFVGCGVGFLAGFVLAILRTRRINRWAGLRWLATLWVEVWRRIPFLVKLMVVFFAFQFAGGNVSMFTVAATTIALSASAFSAENIRAGIESVHPNQWDAAETMNMGGLTALRRVILPQAWSVIIPPSMTYSVGLVKSTSIASQIGVLEMTSVAKILNQKGFSAALCFGSILLMYFVICYSLNRLAAYMEVRLALPRNR